MPLKTSDNKKNSNDISPDTKNPTVEKCVYHFTSFIAIGLFSGDNDFTSPERLRNNSYIFRTNL